MTRFDEHLAYLDWDKLPLFPTSQKALRKRADMVIAGKTVRAPKTLTKHDTKMRLHRLQCGQSLAVPYYDSYSYKDALKFRVKYYNQISGAFFAVIKHKDLNVFEIARFF